MSSGTVSVSPFPNYGVYGVVPTSFPNMIGGIDDFGSLTFVGINQVGQYWYPKIKSGRYIVSNESSFRYLFNNPEIAFLSLSNGINNYTIR
jgi:hypothetical protein